MTFVDQSPRPTWVPRLQRRHEIVTTGGIDGVLRIGAALRAGGFPVRDFTVDVRDGVPYSSVTCTVSLTSDESDTFAERMGAVPAVVAVAPC
jgi:hypothetical protein